MNLDPLLEWNRLNKENTEQALVSVLFMNIVSRSPQIDSFSTWLLAGTGASATLMITNFQNMTLAFGHHGFKILLSILTIASLFGLAAKFIYIYFQAGGDSQEKLFQQIKPIIDKYREDELKIIESAKIRNITLENELSIEKVLSYFTAPFPKLPRKLIIRYLIKHKDNRQVAHLLPIRMFQWQGILSLGQGFTFILFILAAIYYAQAI